MGRQRGGRPPKEDGDQGTKQVRLFTDIAEKILDIADVLDSSSALVADPLIRSDVEELYERHRPAIEKMKALRKQQAELRIQEARKASRR